MDREFEVSCAMKQNEKSVTIYISIMFICCRVVL